MIDKSNWPAGKRLRLFSRSITILEGLSKISGKFFDISTNNHKSHVVPVSREVVKVIIP